MFLYIFLVALFVFAIYCLYTGIRPINNKALWNKACEESERYFMKKAEVYPDSKRLQNITKANIERAKAMGPPIQ